MKLPKVRTLRQIWRELQSKSPDLQSQLLENCGKAMSRQTAILKPQPKEFGWELREKSGLSSFRLHREDVGINTDRLETLAIS